MNKFATLAFFGVLAVAAPAMADTTDQDIQSDAGAIHKDNQALSNDRNSLEQNREQKALDKTNGNYGAQAKDSMDIGGDQAAIGEKKGEKNIDKKILNHDEQDQ